MKRTKSYHESLILSLKDPTEATEYLNTVLEEGNFQMFLTAVRNVAEARGGMVQLSRNAKLNRANLYKMLSKNGNPGIQTLEGVLKALGLRLFVGLDESTKIKKAA